MARTEASLRVCMITQQYDPQYHNGWIDDEQAALTAHDIAGIGDIISARLYNAGIPVAEWHIISHDKDTRDVWDDTAGAYIVEDKPAHYHMLCKMYLDPKGGIKGGTLAQIAAAVGVEPQYIEKAKRGANAYDNMLAYLIHIKYADKAQYSPDAVVSSGLTLHGKALYRPYKDYYNERRAEWLKGRAAVTAQQAAMGIDDLEARILTGEVSRNQVLLTDSLYEIYARNKRRCDDAFATYTDRRIAKAIQAMDNGEFKLTAYYVTGASHAGKSLFTDRLTASIQRQAKERLGETWTVAKCAASNPLDDYDGSEILIMDDLRGVAMTASDWLKLLDPDRANRISARYHNKMVACRVIIINSERDILDFFYFLRGSGGGDRAEALDQFYRRILAHIVVYRVPDDMDVRRITVGTMQECAGYNVSEPGSHGGETLRLHHAHTPTHDMDYDTAITYLTDMAMAQSGAGEMPDVPQVVKEEEQAAWVEAIRDHQFWIRDDAGDDMSDSERLTTVYGASHAITGREYEEKYGHLPDIDADNALMRDEKRVIESEWRKYLSKVRRKEGEV